MNKLSATLADEAERNVENDEEAYFWDREYEDMKDYAYRCLVEWGNERGSVDVAVAATAWKAACEEYLSKVH